MEYLKIRWLHDCADDPVLLLSELDEARYEVRKIEVFADGAVAIASPDVRIGGTRLGEMPVPLESEIAADPQFEVCATSAMEFEQAWTLARTGQAPIQAG